MKRNVFAGGTWSDIRGARQRLTTVVHFYVKECMEDFGWDEVTVARLKQLRLDFELAQRLWQDNR